MLPMRVYYDGTVAPGVPTPGAAMNSGVGALPLSHTANNASYHVDKYHDQRRPMDYDTVTIPITRAGHSV